MPRIIFINRFYWPDESATAQLLADLAEGLAAAGWEVRVIASRPCDGQTPATETRRCVAIERIASPRLGGRGILAKAFDFAGFAIGGLSRLASTAGPGDLVVALTDPPMLGTAAAFIARRVARGCVQWIQDIYPEVAAGVSGRKEPLLLRGIRDRAWRDSAACVTLGSDMAGIVLGGGVAPPAVRVSANWAPSGLEPASADSIASVRREWGVAGLFVAAYSGNLGRVHDVAPILDVAAALRANPGIAIVFIGGGAQRASLEAEAARRGLGNVLFRPPQPRDRLAASLGAPDLHFVTLKAGCERFVFPSKVYGIAAVGRPALFIGPERCEVAQSLVGGGFGLAFDRSRTSAVAEALTGLAVDRSRVADMGARALAFARVNGGAARAIAEWHALLRQVVCACQPRSGSA